MAKKILILLVAVFVCFASFNALALDLTDDKDFTEVTTDASFLLDSPLFTQQESNEKYHQKLDNSKSFGKDPVVSYGDYELYVADYDYSEYEGYEEDEDLKEKFKKNIERSRAFNIRVENKKTGYVWASDGQGKSRQTTAFTVYVSSKEFTGAINSNSIDTRVTYEAKDNSTVVFHVDLINDGITFDYSISLTEDGFNLKMDADSIKETKDSSLVKVSFFPFFGSVYVEKNEETNEKNVTIPGYIVLPTGNGGLIRYAANPTTSDNYYATFYGSDLNYYNDNTKLENTLSMPVYGIVHGVGQEACLVEIKNGSSIATFNYETAGINANDYHKSYLTFNYRQNVHLVTQSSEFNILSEKVDCDVDVAYSFLSGEEDANYIGIARKYQESLVESGALGKAKLAESTQMHVETFGREYEEGLIFRNYVNMTTVNDIVDINHELALDGVNNVFYTLKGYYKGGYSGATPLNINFENKLGNLNKLSDEGLEYYLYYNPVETRGFRLQLPGYNLVNSYRKEYYLEEEKDAKYTFFTDVKTIEEGLEKVINKYEEKVAYDGVTQYLYGDYNHEYTRQNTLDLYGSVFGNELYPMYVPNAYLLGNTSKYLNMPLYHEKMKFITDSVPFTQIVLRGYVDLYSSYLNFSSNQELDVLKCIEYGVYPAYLITEEASHKLSKTLSNNLYATEYDRVKDKMISQYTQVKSVLDQVVGAQIVGRNVLAIGVVEVIYSNGVTVVANYTNAPYTYSKDLVINPMRAGVINNG